MVKPRRRWPARIAGLLGTAGLLGSAAAVAVMAMPSGGEESVLPVAPASPAPAAEAEEEKVKYTDAQRRARRAAVRELSDQGYETVSLGDYDPRARLRVLVGRAEDGSRRAFFFVRREFVGYDSEFPSRRLRVVETRERSVTLRYGLADGGAERVRFRWDGDALTPASEIPAPELRAPAG